MKNIITNYIEDNELTKPKMYSVQITNQKRFAVWGITIFLVFILVFGPGFYYPDARKPLLIVGIISFLSFIGVPMIKKKILSEQKNLALFDNKLIIEGPDEVIINFTEIKDYKISYFRQTFIEIELNNGVKIGLKANSNFTLVASLTQFAEDLDIRLQKLIVDGDLQAKRKKSFFDSIWFLWFMILSTGFMIYSGIAGTIKWHHPPPLYLLFYPFMGLSSIIALIARRKKNKGK